MSTVLVVDDERHVASLVRRHLADEGYRVEVASDAREALEKVRKHSPDLVILDPSAREADGLEVCRRLRQESDTPVIILSARGEPEDRVAGLEAGADDYVVKPFNPQELVARARAVLRRYRPERKPSVLEVGSLRVDRDRREVTVGGRRVELRAKEFDLLEALASRPGAVIGRRQLARQVWGDDSMADSRTIDVHVAGLRDKLRAGDVRIRTVWGVGYGLVVDKATS